MLKHFVVTESRINKALSRVKSLIHRDTEPVDIGGWNVGGEPVPLGIVHKAKYRAFSVGEQWGSLWDTTWFRIRGVVPTRWKGESVVLLCRLTRIGREGFTVEGLV